MNKLIQTLTLPIVAVSLASCAGKGSKTGSQGPVPAGYSAPKSTGSFKLMPYKEVVLENGLKVIYVRDNSLPRVSMTVLFKTGNMQEPKELAGLNAMTAYMLEQGTQTRDAMKIADEFGQMGTSLDVSPGFDVTTVYADSLTNNSPQLLQLVADILMNPAFKDAEINRTRSQILAGLKKKVDNPSAFADEQADLFLFGDHPYGRDTNGTQDSVRALRKQDIIKHYLTFYRPNNATMAVVGQFDDEFEKQVQEQLGKWTKRTIPEVTVAAAPAIEKLQVKLIVKKGLQQTQIRVGQLGISRKSDDFIPLRMANESLGGSFGSRLNQKVRDDLGLTYSIYSNFDARKERGSFDVSTFTKNETAAKALDETLKVLKDFVDNGSTEQETVAARNQLVGQFPRAIETSDRLAYNLLVLDYFNISYDYLTDYISTVNKIKQKDTNAALKKALDPVKFKVVVYGNESIIPQFKDYQPEIVRVK
ncbi:M16 family metallopeptidase [Bdellovibrio sp. HCB209]|uniref:M16 family metallopeptidase n=1 Tax=Bdellovibrio sp. HCB209 TaxID=3394354 RepID=UPI0039B5E273